MQTLVHCDIAIVGGGLVGASLAYALATQLPTASRLSIVLIEAGDFSPVNTPTDERHLVLSLASQRILANVGLWQGVDASVMPLHAVHVSDQGHFAKMRLTSEEAGVEALGYLCNANRLLGHLRAMVMELAEAAIETVLPGLTLMNQTRVIGFERQSHGIQLVLSGQTNHANTMLQASLVIAADGTQSVMRQKAGISTQQYDYQQTACVAKVMVNTADNINTKTKPKINIAYERFTKTGHIALLPYDDEHYVVIWVVGTADVERLKNLSSNNLLALLQTEVGYPLGKLHDLSPLVYYPLRLQEARTWIQPHFMLMGNAAHTLHPLAAQGLNLGLRDVAAFCELLAEKLNSEGGDPKTVLSDMQLLQAYQTWRRDDYETIKAGVHRGVLAFSDASEVFVLARNSVLIAADLIPSIKKKAMRWGMGLSGRLPIMACHTLPAGDRHDC